MKYLYIILAIIGLATILTLFFIFPEKGTPQKDIFISINDHDISKATITEESKKHGYHVDQHTEFFDTLITRELLIQEAERQSINKEESFRQALKTYYENSLVKTLLDRQNSKLQVAVTDANIDTYIGFLGKIVTFTRLDAVPKSAAEALSAKGLTNTVLFSDLATPVRLLLSSLQPSQYGVNFDTGTENYALRLDSVEPSPDYVAKTVDRQRIREMLEEHQREQQMKRWLMELRQNATITIYKEQK
ncbi:MAG: hypothetical protein KJ630_01440 [Proteobacteria bacterium]|nr:hypothetical protein [Pseudomonadota bacterium]